MIYLDNAATTQPLPELSALLQAHIEEDWFNPSALYPDAIRMEKRLRDASEAVASLIHADPTRVVFTSGGTEADNLAIFGGYKKVGQAKRHFITSAYEHPAVAECMKALEAQGHQVDYLRPGADGSIHPEQVAERVREDTALVSIMHVNNETGAVNDIAGLAQAAKAVNPGLAFHSDGVQGYGKCPFDLQKSQVDFYTASAHKLHGLKGTGVFFYKSGRTPRPHILGGGQQGALRSGTENTLGILAFGLAAEHFKKNQDAFLARLQALKKRFLEEVKDFPGFCCFSPPDGAPHILNIAFLGMRGEVLLHLLEGQGIYISTGSACSSKKGKLSRVHQALGVSKEQAEGAVRVSFSPNNTVEEIDETARAIQAALKGYQRFQRR